MKTNRIIRMHWLTAFGLGCLLALWMSSTGCLLLVIPTPHHDTGYARTNLTQLTPQQFTIGKTTTAEVVLALGEPDAVSADEHKLAYRSEKTEAIWIFAAGGGYSGMVTGGGINRERFCIFEFDSQERLQQITQNKRWSSDVGSGEPELPPTKLDEDNTHHVPNCLANERVCIICSNTRWLINANGYQDYGATYMVGEPGRLYLTESNLVFFDRTHFANAEPTLRLLLAEVSRVRVDKYLLAQRLVVESKSGQFHSFEISKPGSLWLDKPAMHEVCEFIQSKIKPSINKP